MSPAERVARAYRLVREASAELQEGNDPTSGVRLIMRAASTELTAYTDPVSSAEYALGLAQEAFNTRATS